MYQVGEYLLYGGHGFCVIEEVTKKEFTGKEKLYYLLHPINNPDLRLYYPVNGDQSKLKPMLTPKEAKKVMEVFKQPAKEWIEKNTERDQYFHSVIQSGNRKDIAEVLKMLMRRKWELEKEHKNLPLQEEKLLQEIRDSLYCELAISLSETKEQIAKQIDEMVKAAGR